MRAISPHANYSHVLIRPEITTGVDASGRIREVEDGFMVNAQFEKSGLHDWEAAVAIEAFAGEFGALPEGVNPLTRVSVFDTEAYVEARWGHDPKRAKDMQARIDAALLHAAEKYPTKLRVVERPALAKPWATYDEQNVQEIFETLAATGTDPQVVWAYEAENKGRKTVFEGLDALRESAAEEEGVASFVVGA